MKETTKLGSRGSGATRMVAENAQISQEGRREKRRMEGERRERKQGEGEGKKQGEKGKEREWGWYIGKDDESV